MSTGYEQTGRTAQKQRTREALLAATRELVAQGRAPTVEDAAAAASISRTTAYRYFPNKRLLLVAAHPEIDVRSLLPVDPPAHPEARLEIVVDEFTRLIVDTEPQQRTMLRLSLEPGGAMQPLPLRTGRAIAWIEDALAPLQSRMSGDEIHRLAVSIRSCIGIETLVWLTDIAQCSREEAREIQRGSALAILQRALREPE